MAKSAGTIMVMSGDDILMEPASSLGPIDAQLSWQGKQFSADAFLKGLDKIKEEVEEKKALNRAYIPILQNISPGEIQHAENARDFAKILVRDWLAKYKFKNWKRTKTKRRKVTPAMRRKRAREIAEKLNETDKWHTHGHGISMAVLCSKEIKLLIEDFGKNKDLSQQIRDYWALLSDHMGKIGAPGAIHVKNRYRHFRW